MEQRRPIDPPHVPSHAVIGQLAGYPLSEALIERRSRRFGHGMRLNGGPLSYKSMRPSQPLSFEEEAALAFSQAAASLAPCWPNCPTIAAMNTRLAVATS